MVFAKEGVPVPVVDMFYQVMVVTVLVLLYGSESWVLSTSGLRILEGYPVLECACHITGMQPE